MIRGAWVCVAWVCVVSAGCSRAEDFGRFGVTGPSVPTIEEDLTLGFDPVDLSWDGAMVEPDMAQAEDLAPMPDAGTTPDLVPARDLLPSVDLTPQPDLGPCAGWRGGPNSACWYVSGYQRNCGDTCTNHGGFDARGSTHLGDQVMAHFFPGVPLDGNAAPSALELYVNDPVQVRVAANGQAPSGLTTAARGFVACACAR
jgi:hypothetical protein